jgi:glyoxylase-like metal-dependent hydrolase (beta-lactamase superfamily II)
MSAAFGVNMDSIRPDFFLQEGDLALQGIDLKVFHTPGHSPGSVSLFWPDHKVLFTGDLVFKDGLGRTDLPGGDGSKLKASIKRLAELDVEWLLSGHGEIVSGSKEVKANFEGIEQFWFAYI